MRIHRMLMALRNVAALTVFVYVWPQLAVADGLTVQVVPAIADTYILPGNCPAQGVVSEGLHVVAAQDQYEPASFVVCATQPLTQLQVTAGPLQDAEGAVLQGAKLDIRVVKRWYQRNFGFNASKTDPRTRFLVPELLLHDDSLVQVRDEHNFLRLPGRGYVNISTPGRLNGFGTPSPEEFPVRDAATLLPLNIAAGDNRQLWVTIYVPPDAAAGQYSTEIILQNNAQRFATLPVELEVLPFQLSEPRINYSIYYRGILNDAWPAGSVSSEFKAPAQMLADFRNLRAHGISNPTVYQPLVGGKLEQVLELRKQAGLATDKLYYLGVDIAPAADVAKPEEYIAQLPDKVRAVRQVTDEFGIGEVYFYARDEARDSNLVEQLPYWDAVRSAGGRIMAAGWRSESWRPGNFAATGGSEDLLNALGMPSRQESAQWHAKRKLIYSYQNPTGGEELPETWRRNYGLLLWQYDYDGAMPYAWQHSYADGWNDFDDIQYRDHNFTYPTIDGSIDTLQWEGLRAAVDDSRYLATLLDALESPAGKASPHAPEVRSWLWQLKRAPLAQRDLAAIRAEMIGHILALGNPLRTATASGESLPIQGLAIGPVRSDGRAAVTWRTPVRATSRVQISGSQGQARRVFESAALDIAHHLQLEGLLPDKEYAIQVTSIAPDGRVAAQFANLSTSVQLGLDTPTLKRSGETAEITAAVNSAYQASIGVDWQQSLRGWWRFGAGDDVTADSSGRNTVVTLEAGAVAADGWFGPGVRLDGSGAFVDASEISIEKNGRATIEGWFRFHSFAMDNQSNMGIFSGIYQHEGNNQFYFNKSNDFFAAASLLTVGVWHHIALSWDGDTGSARLYIDGRKLRPVLQDKIDSIESIDGLRIGDNTGFIGGLLQRSSGTFDGDIDEVRVWNRVLSAAEIRSSFDANSNRMRAYFPDDADAESDWRIIGANAADQVIQK